MNSGVLAIVDGSIEHVEPFIDTVEKEGFDAEQCLEISQEISDLNGNTIAYEGKAAEQFVTEAESVTVRDESNSISVSQEPQLEWKYTNFLLVPDDLLIIDSSAGRFLFSLLESKFDVNIERAEIHLRAYRESLDKDRNEVEPWKIGFYGREGNADNGVIHGTDLLGDDTLGNILAHNATNQLGLTYRRDGTQMKTFVSESGYVEVYQPDNYDTSNFVSFIKEEILPHLRTERP